MASTKPPQPDSEKVAKPYPPRFTKNEVVSMTRWDQAEYDTRRTELLKAMEAAWSSWNEPTKAQIAHFIDNYVGPASDDDSWFPALAIERGWAPERYNEMRKEWWSNWAKYIKLNSKWHHTTRTTRQSTVNATKKDSAKSLTLEPVTKPRTVKQQPALGQPPAPDPQSAADQQLANGEDIIQAIEEEDVRGGAADDPSTREATSLKSELRHQPSKLSPDLIQRWIGARATTFRHPTPRVNWAFAFLDFTWQRAGFDDRTIMIPLAKLKPDDTPNDCDCYRFEHRRLLDTIDDYCQTPGVSRQPDFHLFFHDTIKGRYLDLADPSGYSLALACWCKQPHSNYSDFETLQVTSNNPLLHGNSSLKRGHALQSTVEGRKKRTKLPLGLEVMAEELDLEEDEDMIEETEEDAIGEGGNENDNSTGHDDNESDDEDNDESDNEDYDTEEPPLVKKVGHRRRTRTRMDDIDEKMSDTENRTGDSDNESIAGESELQDPNHSHDLEDDEANKDTEKLRPAGFEFQDEPREKTISDDVEGGEDSTMTNIQDAAGLTDEVADQDLTTQAGQVSPVPAVKPTLSGVTRRAQAVYDQWSRPFTQGGLSFSLQDGDDRPVSKQPATQPSQSGFSAKSLPSAHQDADGIASSPPEVRSDHPTFGRVYSSEQQRSAVYALPFEVQEEIVRKKFKVIKNINDDDHVNAVCEFGPLKEEINVLKLEKFQVVNDDVLIDDDDSEAGDDKDDDLGHINHDDGGADATVNDNGSSKTQVIDVKRGKASISRLLEHFTLENFRNFVKFFRLDVDELMLHSRTRFNFPSMPGRNPYLQQLFIAIVVVKMMMTYGVAILGDEPGLGKTTVKELVYRIWLHLDNLRRDIINDRKEAKAAKESGEGYTRRHLPFGADLDEVCPTANDHIFQCPCQAHAVFKQSQIKAFRGYRLDINQKAQIYNPGMKEAWAMHEGSEHGIGKSGPIHYRVFHPSEPRQAPEDQFQAQQATFDDLALISPDYVALHKDDPDQTPRLKYSRAGELDAEALLGYDWKYVAGSRAKNITIATTPYYVSSAPATGLASELWGTRKNLGTCNIRSSRTVKVGRREVTEKFVEEQKNYCRRDNLCAKPGMMCVDEWHNARGHTESVMKALVKEFCETWSTKTCKGRDESEMAEDFECFIADIPCTRVLLMSGTPLTIGAPKAIDAALKLIRMQQTAVDQATKYFKAQYPQLPPHLSTTSLAQCAKSVASITTDTQKRFKKSVMSVDAASRATTLRQQVPLKWKNLLKEQNKAAAKYLKALMVQRGTSSRMFGQPFGIPIKIHQENIDMQTGLQDQVNQFVIDKEDDVAKEVRRQRKAAKVKKEKVSSAQIMSAMMLSDHSVRSAGAIPGLERARTTWRTAEIARLDRLLIDEKKDTEAEWPEELKGDAWSDMSDEDKKLATTITFYNGEFTARGMATRWPEPPHLFFTSLYKTLLGINEHTTPPEKLRGGAPCRSKAEKFYLWVWKIWHNRNQDGLPECGFLASLSIFELETYRAFAMIEFGDIKSPWYIAKNIDREFFPVYTENWGTAPGRSSAVDYILGEDSDVFVNKWLGGKELTDAFPWLKGRGWSDFTRRPRFLMGSGILAEGISATRFDDLAMLEPFHQKAKITQMACRPQRINSTFAKRISIWCLSSGFYDGLAIGIYKGPKTASQGVNIIQQKFGKETRAALEDEEEEEDDDL